MDTTPGMKRLAGLLLAAAWLLASATAGRAGQNWMPLLPDQDFYDFQMFAPPDLQDYAIRQDPREGIFFTYDRTYWALTPPQSRPILNDFFIPVQPLSPFAVAQLNNNLIRSGNPSSGMYVFGSDPLRLDLNTNWMMTDLQWGNRFEGGWIYDDYGMLFNYSQSGPDSQAFTTTNAFAVNSPTTNFTQTPVSGGGGLVNGGLPLVVTTITSVSPPPDHIITQTLTQRNSTELTSAGFAWAVRRNLSSAGSGELRTMRFTFGPRYLQVADRYSIDYSSNQQGFVDGCPQGDFCDLQNGGWETRAFNNIVGPEFGLNYVFERGRWSIETDLRFTAGMNFQNTLYRGSNFPAALGADYFRSTYTFANTVGQSFNTGVQSVAAPPLFVQIYGIGQTNATNDAEHNFVFAPLGEWRLRGRYRVSKAVSLNVGYTGMWLGSITRASTNTEFRSDLKPVLVATQNGDPIEVGTTGETVPSWTPPPKQEPSTDGSTNNQLRVYNSFGPRAGNDLGYLFVNGVDFGLEINY
ncbi:MAG: BBP7 family outer membrane beta-barrel protein [Planctomycetaceae bacterium]